ncbi:MAG: peroxiredoxin [Candidatus Melainabacteria bacterium]|nr:peroxiredoxin [Candidatus Melainabacteria bacterium]
MLKAGDKFPEFALQNQDDKTISSADLRGKWVILYVYPKDDTPGCTLEGKGFSASKADFDKLNTVIYGLSADDSKSHKDFCNKYDFTIDLLADTKNEVLDKAEVGQSDYKGTNYWNRVTFIIDPEGKVAKAYDGVKPDGHEKQVFEDLKQLQAQPVK